MGSRDVEMGKWGSGLGETIHWGVGESEEDEARVTFSGKLSLALLPLKWSAATSYARAAASADVNVPSQTLAAL